MDNWNEYVYVRMHQSEVEKQAKADYEEMISGNYEKWEAFLKNHDMQDKYVQDRIDVLELRNRELSNKLNKLIIIYLIITCVYIAILVLKFLK